MESETGTKYARIEVVPNRQLIWPSKSRVRSAVAQYVRDAMNRAYAGKSPWPLMFTGETGSGKTCAALVMLDVCGGVYYNLRDLADRASLAKQRKLEWRGSHAAFYPTPEEFWETWAARNLCVLDELADTVKQTTEGERATLKDALDWREGQPLVCVTNRTIAELADPDLFGDPIASRLACGTVVKFSGDRRTPSKP